MGMQRWRRPSEAGRRVCLDRKYRLNVAHYGGRTKLVTLTPPGEDLLAFGDETRKLIDGDEWRLVAWEDRTVWNWSAQARASRLMEAAQRCADRFLRRSLRYTGTLPRQLGNVRAEQKRGVWHFHFLLPYETKLEQQWSRVVHQYLDRAWQRDQERWPDAEERRELIWREYCGEVTRGFYGFGYVNGGNPVGRSAEKSAGYMARNAAGYMGRNAAGPGRHYVSSRLTRETGVTMKALRACNWLYVRRKMIDAGELSDAWVPSHWSDAWRDEVLRVWEAVQPAVG
jgi:hypothetical protein